MVCFHEIDRAENSGASKIVSEVTDVSNWIPIRYGTGVKGAVIATRPPSGVFLWCQMKW